MTLIKSISGIRGTIGGKTSDNLTPIDAVKFAAAYGTFIKNRNPNKEKITVVVGRDARISGKMISSRWDNFKDWDKEKIKKMTKNDTYTLRRKIIL